MSLSIVREGEGVELADVLVFNAGRSPLGDLFGSDASKCARERYLEGHAERMERIRSLAREALAREKRKGKAGGAGGD